MILKILLVIVIMGFVAFAAICIESYRENRIIKETNYDISSKKLKKDFKAVVISDLHNSEYGENNKGLLSRIDKISPDIILIAGDLIIGKEGYDVRVATKLLLDLGEKYKVYVSKGNHELRCSLYKDLYGSMWDDLFNGTKDKVNWLINEDLYLDEYNVDIFGLDMDRDYYKRFKKYPMDDLYLKNTLPQKNTDSFNILLGHNPDYFEEYAAWGADISFSGHVHGGMIIMPGLGGLLSPMVRFFPKYYKGLYEIGNQKMIVSGGLGIHTFRFRVNNKPDLVCVNFKVEK